MDKPTEFYRYEAVRYAESEYSSYLQIELRTYNLHKETPKGYWISYGNVTYPEGYKLNYRSHLRWIPKLSRKRHAYPTKEEALNSFKIRTHRRAKILNAQLSDCQTIMHRIKGMEQELTKSN